MSEEDFFFFPDNGKFSINKYLIFSLFITFLSSSCGLFKYCKDVEYINILVCLLYLESDSKFDKNLISLFSY